MGENDRVSVTKQKIIDIADQIRAELSETDEYKLDVMPTKIHEVAQGGGGSAVINPLSITANGTYTATGNVDGYSPITVAVPSVEDGVKWVRDFDFTQSEDDRITGLSAVTNNCNFNQGTGLEWMNYSSKVEAFFTFNQDYNYDIIFKFDGSDFGATGSVATLTSGTNLNLVITSDGENVELGYSVGSGSITSTGIDIESLANEEIKLQLRLNNSNNWDVTLVIAGMNYSQNIGTLNGKNRYYFTFGKGQQDSFINWILKYIQIKQIIGDGSQRTLESLNATTNGTYYPSSGHYGFDRVEVDVSSSANLDTLNVTENGTYTPTAPVDGWDNVVVDVAPSKVKISEFNFKTGTTYTPYYDMVKEIDLATNMRGMSAIQGTGLRCDAGGAKLRTGTNFDYAGIYEIEIPFGTFDRTTAVRNGNNFILTIGRGTYALMLCYQYNSSTDTGKWWIHDQTGANVYLDYGDNDPYFFENKTLHLFYGAKIVNGEIVRDASRGYFYVNGVQLNSVGAYLTGDIDNGVQVFMLGDGRGSGGFIGVVYESLKIYQYFDKYATPVSLMSASPSESKSSSESEEKTDEVKEQKKDSVEKKDPEEMDNLDA